jgi:hypothetical protein
LAYRLIGKMKRTSWIIKQSSLLFSEWAGMPGQGLTVKMGKRVVLDASQNNVTIYFSGFTFTIALWL